MNKFTSGKPALTSSMSTRILSYEMMLNELSNASGLSTKN